MENESKIMAEQNPEKVKRSVAKKMPSKNRLSNDDKSKILNMTVKDMPIDKIAESLDKTVSAIEKYLAPIKESLILNEKIEIKSSDKVAPEIFNEVLNKLESIGLDKSFAKTALNNVINKLNEEELKAVSKEMLYNRAISANRIRMLMKTKAEGGREGVAVMTGAASEAIDHRKAKRYGQDVRNRRDVIFKSH